MEGSGCCRRGLGYGLCDVSNEVNFTGDDWECTVRVEPQEPLFLLLVGHDVDEGSGPLGSICVLELFEQDLDGLAVGSVHGDEVNAFGILWVRVSIVRAPTLDIVHIP